MDRKPLQFPESYLHYNGLIWQVPSIGIAIAAGVIVAAEQVGGSEGTTWPVTTGVLRSTVLALGGLLLIGLNAALARFRDYQAACHEHDSTHPIWKERGFGLKPPANRVLQCVLCLATGLLLTLAVLELSATLFAPIGVAVAVVIWWLRLEAGRNEIVEDLNRWRKGEETGPSTLKRTTE